MFELKLIGITLEELIKENAHFELDVAENYIGIVNYSNHKVVYVQEGEKWEKHLHNEHGQEIYSLASDGEEHRKEYDREGNLVHEIIEDKSMGIVAYEADYTYDNRNNCLSFKDSVGDFFFKEYEKREDDFGDMVYTLVYHESQDGIQLDTRITEEEKRELIEQAKAEQEQAIVITYKNFDEFSSDCESMHYGYDRYGHCGKTCRREDNTPVGCSWGICKKSICPRLKR